MSTMRRVWSWYGADPLHLLALLGCFALAAYAGLRLFDSNPIRVAVWFVGAVLLHDLVLFSLYAVADRSMRGVLLRRRPPGPPAAWVNHVRVPVVISAMVLLVYFPVVLRLPGGLFESITTYPVQVYVGRYLAIVGALFLGSALAYAVRLRRGRRRPRAPEPQPQPVAQ